MLIPKNSGALSTPAVVISRQKKHIRAISTLEVAIYDLMLSDLKIRRFTAILERRLNRYLAKSGLDLLSLAVLTAATEQARSEVDIATLLDVHPNTLVQLCRRLEQLDLITRLRDPNDKRRLLLVPSPAARTLVRKAKRTKLLALIFHPLTQDEITQFNSLITKLLDSHKGHSPLD